MVIDINSASIPFDFSSLGIASLLNSFFLFCYKTTKRELFPVDLGEEIDRFFFFKSCMDQNPQMIEHAHSLTWHWVFPFAQIPAFTFSAEQPGKVGLYPGKSWDHDVHKSASGSHFSLRVGKEKLIRGLEVDSLSIDFSCRGDDLGYMPFPVSASWPFVLESGLKCDQNDNAVSSS